MACIDDAELMALIMLNLMRYQRFLAHFTYQIALVFAATAANISEMTNFSISLICIFQDMRYRHCDVFDYRYPHFAVWRVASSH